MTEKTATTVANWDVSAPMLSMSCETGCHSQMPLVVMHVLVAACPTECIAKLRCTLPIATP